MSDIDATRLRRVQHILLLEAQRLQFKNWEQRDRIEALEWQNKRLRDWLLEIEPHEAYRHEGTDCVYTHGEQYPTRVWNDLQALLAEIREQEGENNEG